MQREEVLSVPSGIPNGEESGVKADVGRRLEEMCKNIREEILLPASYYVLLSASLLRDVLI